MTNQCAVARRPLWLASLLSGLLLAAGNATAADVVTYYHTDGLGTPVMESNAAGQVTYTREHRPYGEQALGTAKHGPGFTGHVGDADSGLIYMQARYYDPVAGRFLSNDPVAVDVNTGANNNRYRYANNNPYKFTDPDGRRAKMEMSGLCDWAGGCDSGSFSSGDGSAASFGEPADATGGVRNPANNPWRNVLKSSCTTETSCSLSGTVTVSSVDSAFSASKIAEILSTSYNGVYQYAASVSKTVTYTVNIIFKAVERGGDLVLKAMTNRQLAWAREKHQPIFGLMFFNSNTMYLNRTRWDDVAGIVPHEFGHGIGLEHTSNSEDSIMNYNFGSNRVSGRDIHVAAESYR